MSRCPSRLPRLLVFLDDLELVFHLDDVLDEVAEEMLSVTVEWLSAL